MIMDGMGVDPRERVFDCTDDDELSQPKTFDKVLIKDHIQKEIEEKKFRDGPKITMTTTFVDNTGITKPILSHEQKQMLVAQ